ncbi:WYL domain-containing protein [Brevibacterium daeguense]|uniref:WYL domain-containing protein n=1 Tax=Brevibacterium daeguense TaxID=909936 RepID=A0ABP8ENN6_9MICO|nr:WYL domain-containing protein [Brevibacterium daeguense]
MRNAADRLSRLLGLVPYLLENPGAELEHTAALFDVSPDVLIDDLQLLFVTGRPGRMPDDLIEASWEDGRIYVGNADEVSVPVRLTRDEATSLLIALDYLSSLDPERSATVDAVRRKVRAATGLDDADSTVQVELPPLDEDVAATIRAAAAEGSGLALEYYVPARDELTERTVTPRALRLAGQWYMDAWCHTSNGERSFAVANIRTLAPAEAPPAPEPAPAGGQERQAAEARTVRLVVAPPAAWIADELDPLEVDHDTHGPGTVMMTLQVFSQTWLTRLLLQHGRHILDVAPPDLARDALREVTAALGPASEDDSPSARD